jgi:hypothetical protein
MTTARLNGLVLILWICTTALIISIAINAAHFSPWELLVPQQDPATWIAPALIFIPPLILKAFMGSATRLRSSVALMLSALLTLALVATFVLFAPSAYLGS